MRPAHGWHRWHILFPVHLTSPPTRRFSTSLLYYGLSLNVGSFGLNIYLTQFIFGAAELPAVLSGFVLNERLGRRLSQVGFMMFGGVACLLVLAVPKGNFTTKCEVLTFRMWCRI